MEPGDYQEQAAFTLSGQFHGDKVTMVALRFAIEKTLQSGELLDEIKKALFYGKGEIGTTRSLGILLATAAPYLIADVAEGPLTDAKRTAAKEAEVILHMALGKVTEACEFLEAVFKAMNGAGPLDKVNLCEEIGDGLWYDANALSVLRSNFPAEMSRNNEKLRARFPEGFTEHDANNRDLFAERLVLEAGEPVRPGDKVTLVGLDGEKQVFVTVGNDGLERGFPME